MKNLIIAIVSVLTLLSCSPTPPTNEEIAEESVVKDLLDPNSWELISSEMMDTVRVSDMYILISQEKKNVAFSKLETMKHYTELAELSSGTRLVHHYVDKAKSVGAEGMEYSKMAQSYLDSSSMVLNTPQDTILCITYKVKGYATSRDGQKRIGSWLVNMRDNVVINKAKLD